MSRLQELCRIGQTRASKRAWSGAVGQDTGSITWSGGRCNAGVPAAVGAAILISKGRCGVGLAASRLRVSRHHPRIEPIDGSEDQIRRAGSTRRIHYDQSTEGKTRPTALNPEPHVRQGNAWRVRAVMRVSSGCLFSAGFHVVPGLERRRLRDPGHPVIGIGGGVFENMVDALNCVGIADGDGDLFCGQACAGSGTQVC